MPPLPPTQGPGTFEGAPQALAAGAVDIAQSAASLPRVTARLGEGLADAVLGEAAGALVRKLGAIAPQRLAGDFLEEKAIKPAAAFYEGGEAARRDAREAPLGEKLKEPSWALRQGLRQLPQLATSLGSAGAKGASVAGRMAAPFVMEAGEAARGLEEEEARTGEKIGNLRFGAAVAGKGAVNAGLELAGAEAILGRLTKFLPASVKKTLGRNVAEFVTGSVGEGLTERGQQVVGNFIQMMAADPPKNWTDLAARARTPELWQALDKGGAEAQFLGSFIGTGATAVHGASRAADVRSRAGRMADRRAWMAEEGTGQAPAPIPSVESGPRRGAVVQADIDAINEAVRATRNPETADDGLRRLKLVTASLDARLRSLKSGAGMTTNEAQVPRPPYRGDPGDEFRNLVAEAASLDTRLEELRTGRFRAPAPAPAAAESPLPPQPHRPIPVDRIVGADALSGILQETDAREAPVRAAEQARLEDERTAARERLISDPASALAAVLEEEAAPSMRSRAFSDGPPVVETLKTPDEVDRGLLGGLGLTGKQARKSAAGPRDAPEGLRGKRAEAVGNGQGSLVDSPRGLLPRGVEDEGRGRETFRKRHGEDAAGLERFLALADAVRQEASDATPQEIHEAAFALFAQERKLDARPARTSAVDTGTGAANPGNGRGRRVVAEGARRAKGVLSGADAPGSVARSFSRPPNPNTSGISVRDLRKAVSRAEVSWPAAPEIAVIRDESELPLEVQEAIGTAKVRGVYHGGRHGAPRAGTVFLLADRVGDLDEAFETLAHEIVGHAGVVGVLGPRGWKRTIDEILASSEGRRLVDEWNAERGSEYNYDLTIPEGKGGAVAETLAWLAERKIANPDWTAPGFYRRVVARIRVALRGLARQFGVSPKSIEWTEADIDALLARAGRYYEGPTGTAGEGTQARFSRVAEDGAPDQEPALSEAQRRRVEEIVSRTRARLAETDPRWRRLAEDLAAEPAGDRAEEQPARPDLANPGVEPEGRRLVDRVDRAREQQNEPGRRADAEVNAEADRRLEADWEGERNTLLSRGRQGAGLDDVETVTAKKIVSAETFAAMRARDAETLGETAELIDAYRRTGTEQARAFRQRRDEVKSPRERMAAFVAEAVLRPGDATAEKIRTGSPAERKAALKKHGEQAKAVLERLKDRGIDVARLSDEDLADRFLVARVVREVAAQRADLSDKVFEYWANSILSGPLTHVANVTGNTISLALEYGVQQPLEMALGSVAGGSRSLAEGKALYGSLWRGVMRGARNAVESFQTEQRALGDKGDPLAPDRLEARVAIAGKTGRAVRIPYRFLRAADEFYRGVIGEMEAAASAHGIARKEGLAGEALGRRMEALLEDGESAAWQAATDRADLLTFQQEMGRYGQLVLDARRKVPGLRYIIPFVTTPANIFKTALRKTPLGGARSLYLLARGELSRDQAIRSGAEQLIGLGVIALLAQGLGGGDDDKEPVITGTVPFRGSRKGERDMAERTAPPLSVRVNGKWYGYGRLEPLATWLGVTVDTLRGVKEARAGADIDAVIGKTLKRFVAQLEDKTFLDGLGRIIRAIDDGKSAARVVGDVGAGFVPALIRQPAQAAETKVRESRTWGAGPSEKHEGERYESRLARRIAERAAPFLFKGAPRVNAYGENIEKPNRTYVGRLLSPVQRFDPETLSPAVRRIDAAFRRWNDRHPEAPYYPPIPDPRYTRGGRIYFLSDEEYRVLLVRAGASARERLEGLVDFSGGPLTPGDIERARKIFRDAAKSARESLKGERAGGLGEMEVEP